MVDSNASNIPTRDSPSRGFFTWREDISRINSALSTQSDRISNLEGTTLKTGHFDNLARKIHLLELRVQSMAEIMDRQSRALHELQPGSIDQQVPQSIESSYVSETSHAWEEEAAAATQASIPEPAHPIVHTDVHTTTASNYNIATPNNHTGFDPEVIIEIINAAMYDMRCRLESTERDLRECTNKTKELLCHRESVRPEHPGHD